MDESLGLSRTTLLAIKDDVDFVGAVIDDIWMMPWPEDDTSQEYVEFYRSLPKEKRIIWATWRLQAEVDNGGFGQYFTNIEDDCYISEALEGLTVLGAHEQRQMLEQVIEYRDSNAEQIAATKTWDEYVKIMGAVPLNDALDDITFRFIKLNSRLYTLRKSYIMEHLIVFAPQQ